MAQNDQKTFLPNLRTLTWVETPDYDGILALLASPSLTWLELRVQSNTRSRQVEKAIHTLSLNAPFLSSLPIHSDNEDLEPLMSGFQRLRSLVIHNDVTRPDLKALTPRCRQTLQDLRYCPESFTVALDDTMGRLALPNLRSLQLFGPLTDRMCAFVAYLHTPDVGSLKLELRDEKGNSCNSASLPAHIALSRTVSEASFAPALRQLSITVQTKANLSTDPTTVGGTRVMGAMLLLFSLVGLRVLVVVYFCSDATLGTDADMLAAATAWRDIEHLSFDFPFSDVYDQGGFPCLSSLAHFAAHCPRLTRLRIPLAVLDPPPELEGNLGQHSEGTGEWPPASLHPLRTLEIQVRQWGSEMEPEMVARRIDELFPNLGRDELRFRYPIRPRIAPRRYQGRWDSMISAWKELRAAREGDVRDA
ncbi:hypothetical protein GSI_11823 [Ganoderma sinense ZZ0214-1]|uniref:F-box domain-containing protein n=1 Tax=Ganoderma sinense ZZ0214-1 TaxID=1077348 RepID=A0A2G8RX23_9APHY|nr:hypothetical protein GSI_11823 [Ganoderma sinense ZZ0214-1]